MLKGTLDDFTLPDIFRLMSFAKKTGRVDITRSAGEGHVFFREGEVYFATSSLSKEPLGQKLVRMRALSEGQLMKALDQHKASGERLGTVLIKTGIVTPDQLEAAIRQQIEDAVFDLLRWELGEFSWEPGDELDVEIPIAVSVENLIMEASRRLDEFEVIKRKIPSGESILGMAPTPPEGAVEINITPDEWRILVLVDGTRTVNEIGKMVGLDEFAAMRVLYGLVSAGLIELVSDPSMAPTTEEAVEAVMTEAQTTDLEAVAQPEPVVERAPEPVAAPPEPAPEPEPVAVVEPAPVATPEPELVAAVEPEPAVIEPPPVVEPEPVIEPEPVAEVIAEEPTIEPVAEPAIESLGAVDPLLATPDAEMSPEQLEEFGITPPLAATTDDAAWSERTAPVEAFDAPGPDELITETPAPDPFAPDLFGDVPATPPAPEMEDSPVPPMPAAPTPPAPEAPAATPPAAGSPVVDRAAVVRELAGLFNEGDDRPRARPSAPRARPSANAGTSPGAPPAPAAPGQPAEDDGRKRVEDDDQVTKGIISRLIDGVKGL
ncbi:MAG: DUF4388 domain-containing protein [Actinomycetota bacterium]|nr:DUF4388 domain-containing protein [Actinomycetota bacterium]